MPFLPTMLPSTFIPWGFNYTFFKSDFTDEEDDPYSITCSNTTTSAGGSKWIMLNNNTVTGNMTFFGIPTASNTFAGTYTITCLVRDIFDAPPTTYSFSIIINPNKQVTISNPPNQSIRRPFST